VIGLNGDVDDDLEDYDLEDLRDNIVTALNNKFKYLSVINEYGENVYEDDDCQTESFDELELLEVLDDDGNVDIEKTADLVMEDFLANRAIIAMLYDKNQYDELEVEDRSWLNSIIEDEEE
jgi:hypothetical protein